MATSRRGRHSSSRSRCRTNQLVDLGNQVIEQHFLPELWGLLQALGTRRGGVRTPFWNLIFSADGPKPELVLTDAVSNTIEIVRNEEFCLVYDRPLGEAGISWADLVDWRAHNHAPAGTS